MSDGTGDPREPGTPGLERAEDIAADVEAPEDGPVRGIRALGAEQFSLAEAIGGPRGLVESLAPGLVFIVCFVATGVLAWSLIASVAVAVGAVVVRLVQRTPMTQAFGGFLGVVIGVVWAWRSGDGRDYFAWGLWTNAAYLTVIAVSIMVRWPLVGVVVEALRGGLAAGAAADEQSNAAQPAQDRISWSAWRANRALVRRYAAASWLWVGLFGLRLLVQVPLYSADEVGWLGTARLVMGLPLWALVLWLTWVLVRRPHAVPTAEAPPR